jgi:hypothetical protein
VGDSELAKTTVDSKASVKVTVKDTLSAPSVSTSLSGGSTKYIANQALFSLLKDGSSPQDFPGLGPFIDTKMVYRDLEMFLGLTIDAQGKSIINTNVNRFLDVTAPPVFFTGGVTSFPGGRIDAASRFIEVTISEMSGLTKTAETIISWKFDANKVVRTYRKDCLDED